MFAEALFFLGDLDLENWKTGLIEFLMFKSPMKMVHL